MKKRFLALFIAVTMLIIGVPGVMAEEQAELNSDETQFLPLTETTESAQVTQISYEEDFESYTAQSGDNTTVLIDNDSNRVLEVSRDNTSSNNTEVIALDTAIEQDIVELEFKVLPRLNSGTRNAEAYLQLMQGSSNARLNIKISADSGDKTKYRVKIGSVIPITANDLYHLPLSSDDDNGNFISEKFNTIKIIMHRALKADETIDNDLSKVHVYLNDAHKGSYTFTEIGAGTTYTAGKKIESIRTYQYAFGESEPPVYFDDISIKGKSEVPYVPAQLSMSFSANMNYDSTPTLIVSNATDSMYLEQQFKLSLIDAENENSVTEIATCDATKVASQEGDTASFSFAEELSVSPGWYYASVDRYIGGVKKGEGSKQKIYVATAQQLSDLPGDFANLPEDNAQAQSKVEYYLPCFLSEEEINELLPKTDGTLTTLGAANLKFITDYFKESTAEYTTMGQVQTDFVKAKGYLELKNAGNMLEVRSVLAQGGYLDDYLENEVFSVNEEAFFSHFESKRTDSNNPLVSDAKVKKALRYAMAMTALNAAKRSGVFGVVEKYNDIFLLDLTAVTAENADDVYPALYNKGYTTLTKIQEDWQTAIDAIPQEPQVNPELSEKDYSSGSGSSGGGGGGGGSIKTDSTEALLPQIEPTDVVEEEKKTQTLSDIENHWANKEIKVLYEMKIVTGFEDGSFRPEATLTRAELAVMLSRILPDNGEDGEASFSDVSNNDWYYDAVGKAFKKGIIQGVDGKFLPNDSITREQLATMIYRALDVTSTQSESSFKDGEEISSYAKEAVAYLTSAGILSGYEDSTFRPKNTASRAEAAKLLCSLLDNLS